MIGHETLADEHLMQKNSHTIRYKTANEEITKLQQQQQRPTKNTRQICSYAAFEQPKIK